MTQPSAAEAPIEVVGGTQIPLDAAYILDIILKNAQAAKGLDLTQRGQDIETRGQDITQRGQDMVYLQALMNYNQQGRSAAAAYDIDLKNYGAQVARDNFQQRLSEAQLRFQDMTRGIDLGRFQLEKDTLNFQQRATKAGLEQSALGMLADRSGPQDWVGYSSLLEGLSGPQAYASGQVDPLALLKDLVQPSQAEVPEWAQGPLNTSGLVQPHTASAPNASSYMSTFGVDQSYRPPSAPPAAVTGAPGGLGPVSDYVQKPVQDNFTYATLGRGTGAEWASGVPIAQVKTGWNYLPTGAADAIDVSRFDPSVKAYIGDPAKGKPTSQATGTIAAGTPFWLERMAAGGTMTPMSQEMARSSMAGLQPGSGTGMVARPTASVTSNSDPGYAASVRPPTSAPRVNFDPTFTKPGGLGPPGGFASPPGTVSSPYAPVTRPPIDPSGGLVPGAGPLYPGFDPRMAPVEPRPLPYFPPGRSNWYSPYNRGGEMPVTRGGTSYLGSQPLVPPSVWSTPLGRPRQPVDPSMWRNAPRAAGGGQFQIGPVQVGEPVSGAQPGGTEEMVSVRTDDPNATLEVDPTNPMGQEAELVRLLIEMLGPERAQAIIEALGLTGMPEDMGAPPMGPGGAAPAPPMGAMGPDMGAAPPMPQAASGGSYGTAATDPFMTFNAYRPRDLGNQPWIQALRGERPQSLWSGFGAQLSNPRLGIQNMPDTLNLQTFNRLPGSARTAAANLYNKGLSVDFNDILERSQRAAPEVAAVGATAYG